MSDLVTALLDETLLRLEDISADNWDVKSVTAFAGRLAELSDRKTEARLAFMLESVRGLLVELRLPTEVPQSQPWLAADFARSPAEAVVAALDLDKAAKEWRDLWASPPPGLSDVAGWRSREQQVFTRIIASYARLGSLREDSGTTARREERVAPGSAGAPSGITEAQKDPLLDLTTPPLSSLTDIEEAVPGILQEEGMKASAPEVPAKKIEADQGPRVNPWAETRS